MKKIITIMSRQAARTVVTELAAKGIAGMTLIEAAPDSSFGPAGVGEDVKPRVRLEIVIESHRADEVIESVEALLDSAEAVEPTSARLVVEDVSTVVHIRSGRVLI